MKTKAGVEEKQLFRLAKFLNDEMGISHLKTDQDVSILMDKTISLIKRQRNKLKKLQVVRDDF